MLLVCYSFLNSQNISIKNSVKRLVGRTPPKQLEKLPKLYRKTSNNWSMMNFIHNGSEITNALWYSFKTKSTKFKATSLRYEHLFGILNCRSLDQHKDIGVVRQVAKTAIFTAAPVTKTYLAVQFTKPCFFVNLFTEKLLV